MSNLIEAIQKECQRVRETIPHYEAIGPAGAFGAMMLKQSVKRGEAAIASDDMVEMVKALAELKGCAE